MRTRRNLLIVAVLGMNYPAHVLASGMEDFLTHDLWELMEVCNPHYLYAPEDGGHTGHHRLPHISVGGQYRIVRDHNDTKSPGDDETRFRVNENFVVEAGAGSERLARVWRRRWEEMTLTYEPGMNTRQSEFLCGSAEHRKSDYLEGTLRLPHRAGGRLGVFEHRVCVYLVGTVSNWKPVIELDSGKDTDGDGWPNTPPPACGFSMVQDVLVPHRGAIH